MRKDYKSKITKHTLITILIIVIVCVAVFSLTAIVYIDSDVTSRFERIIVNDSYDSNTIPLTDVDVVYQTVYVSGKIYGFRIPISYVGEDPDGIITLELLNSNNQVVSISELSMSELTDGFFHNFILEKALITNEVERYTLRIKANPVSSSTISLKKSSTAVACEEYILSDFILYENNSKQEGVLALQYISKYSGNFIYTPYILISFLLTVFFIALYLMVFVYKTAIHRVFLTASLVLGMVFLIIIPFRTAPDEYVHIANTYSYSNKIFGIKDKNGSVFLRHGDDMFLKTYDYDATNIFSYREVAEELFSLAPKGEGTVVKARNSTKVYPLAYIPSLIGVVIARLLGLSKTGLLFLGRLFNLLFYSIGVMYAIKLIPFRKPMLTLVGLLPICLSLAASFSYDVFVITLSFIFLSLILRIAKTEGKIKIKSIIAPVIVGILLAPAKAIYIPMLLLVLLIPFKRYESKGKTVAVLLTAILLAAFLWVSFNTDSLKSSIGVNPYETSESIYDEITANEVVYDVLANNETKQLFTFSYIIHHIPQTVILLSRSIVDQSPVWIQGLIGGRLGEIIAVNIEINWVLIVALILIVLLSTIDDSKESNILTKHSRLFMMSIGSVVIILSFFVCISWTPISYTTIFGIQGRYFIPVVPLYLLSINSMNLKYKNKPTSVLIYCFCVVVMLVALNAFTIIIRR